MKALGLILLVAVLAMGTAVCIAQDTAAGAVEYNLLTSILTGTLGYAFGLTVTIIGLFVIIRGNFSGGVTLIILGVLVTLAPNVYSAVRSFTCPLAVALGASTCGGSTATPAPTP